MASHLSSMSSQGHQAARAEFISAGEGNGSATALNGEHQKEPGFPYLEPEEAEQEEENLRGSVKSTFSSGLVGYGASESWALGVQTSGSSDAGHPMKTFSHKARVNSLPRLTDSALETFAEDTSRDWHNNTRPDDVSSRSRERETSFEDLIDKDELNEYMEQEISHPTTRAILESEAGKLDEHLQRFKKAFIMDRVTSDINTPSLYARSQEHRLNDNPRNDPEPALDMTTGQFAAGQAIAENKHTPVKSTILASGPGQGKSGACLEGPEQDIRRSEQEALEGKDVTYSPTLLVVPVQMVAEWIEHIRSFTSGYTIYAYYFEVPARREVWYVKRRQLRELVEGLPRSAASTGRTIIITSYNTLYVRLIGKTWNYMPSSTQALSTGVSGHGDALPLEEDVVMPDAFEEAGDVPVEIHQDNEDISQSNNDSTGDQRRDIYEDGRERREYTDPAPGRHGRYVKLTTYHFKQYWVENYEFNMIILDEAHKLKNAESDHSRAMRLFKCRSIVYITSTPLYSALSDLLSPLKLMWNVLGIRCTFSHAIGDWVGLYDPDYDPEGGLAKDGGADNPEMTTHGLFPLLMQGGDDDQHACEVFKAAWNKYKIPLWQLSPQLLKETAMQHNWSVEFGRKVIRPLLERFSVRWSRSSKIALPNGTNEYLGVGIPPVTTITEELGYKGDEHERVRDMCYKLEDELIHTLQQGSVADASRLMPSQIYGINFRKYRDAVFYSFDARFMTLFSNTYADECPNRELTRSGSFKSGGKTVQDLIDKDPMGGLMFWFENTKEPDHMNCPSNRADMVRWLLQTNPILTRLLHHLVELVCKGEHRVVVYVNYPMIQQLVAAFLSIAGFEVRTVRPWDKPNERNKAIREFNDGRSSVQILVVGIATMNCGINLHLHCHHGIIMTFDRFAHAMSDDHVKATLSRHGQKHMPDWRVLQNRDTFHDYEEQSVLKKKVRIFAVLGRFPEWVCPFLREIICYEMLKSTLNTAFNRYAWIVIREHSPECREHHTRKIRKIGHMCSLLVRMLLVAPEGDKREFLRQRPDQTIDALYRLTHEDPWTLEKIEDLLTQDNRAALRSDLFDALVMKRAEVDAEEQEGGECKKRLKLRRDNAVTRSHGDATDLEEAAGEEGDEEGLEDGDEEESEEVDQQGSQEVPEPGDQDGAQQSHQDERDNQEQGHQDRTQQGDQEVSDQAREDSLQLKLLTRELKRSNLDDSDDESGRPLKRMREDDMVRGREYGTDDADEAKDRETRSEEENGDGAVEVHVQTAVSSSQNGNDQDAVVAGLDVQDTTAEIAGEESLFVPEDDGNSHVH